MKLLRSIGFVLSAVLLSLLTVVFSSVPLMILRRQGGSATYWILSLTAGLALVLSGQVMYWAPFLSIVILIGLYGELEAGGLKTETAALWSVAGSCGFIVANLVALHRINGFDLNQTVQAAVTELATRIHTIEPTAQLDVNSIVPQIPSAMVIFLMFSLWMALLSVRRLKTIDQPERDLSMFSVPDSLVWIFLLSIVASFFDFGEPMYKTVGENVFNVMLYAYFLQGMAITGAYFRASRVAWWGRAILYCVFVTQLFLLMSVLGFVDFWIDFRRRIVKKSAETMGEV